ncbi:alpha/beta hydrolase [Steroidobacter agaridevorans]|uniref:Alpha/beta hydrolase n=1 Tax=Steroidobacter agaridevorans TaxID=2695856 RepID=A0A829YF79_9GAMM|nr:alpha/beta hydrolase [Steroidobacter agaridevorans]GFE81583.1 alpha/beta hydrolase [Steroidobacter agaridevorans]GFE90327.1 alpha/beta hydrolase [Steroidobacter agaridevorans]
MKTLLSFGIFLAIVYVGLCAALFFFQRSMIYYPQPRPHGETSATLPLSVDGAELVISVRAHEGPNAIVYFGGNGENVTYNLPSFSDAFPDHALYLMNYRGYGGSSGSPDEAAISQDALALFDYVHARHPNVIVMGRSLGSGVAIRLATQRPATRLVLITPFASIAELGASQFPMFPVKWLIRDKYESFRYAPRVDVPTLLVVAEHDEIIPRASTDALYAAFRPGIATRRIIPDTGHNTISATAMYVETLQTALAQSSKQ